jgi:hypothetical protein
MNDAMKSPVRGSAVAAWQTALRRAAAAAVAGIVVAAAGPARAVFDDFSDLNDTANPAWTHLSGLVASSGQTWDASTGQYRLMGPNNGVAIGDNGQLGFVGSYTGPSFTDVEVSADFVGSPTGVAYGVAARLNGNNGINALSGYAYAYEPFAASGAGEVVLYRVDGASLDDIGAQQVTLDMANKDYTFVLRINGDQLHGQVFEVGGGMVAERFATDATYASGFSGVFGYSAAIATLPINYTIDNFRAQVPEPAAGLLLAVAAVALGCQRRVRAKP